MLRQSSPRLDCVLAIPCFRESERLPIFLEDLANRVAASSRHIHLQLIEDGSGEEERTKIVELAKEIGDKYRLPISTHILADNRGKGFAIRHGWINAPDSTLLGFADADGAAPANEVMEVLGKALETPDELTIGSRYLGRAKPKRKMSRRLFSLGFRLLFKVFYRIDCSDTQCGLKFVPSSFFKDRYWEFHQNRWGFDLELILRAANLGVPIREISIQWTESPGSKVRIGNVMPLIRDMMTDRL